MDETHPPAADHVPVLVDEVIAALSPRAGQTLVDLTIGRGGHAAAIGRLVGPDGRVIGFDLDAGNADFARERVAAAGSRVETHHASFVEAPVVLRAAGVVNPAGADMVLADLGFASNQMDDPLRGFSFRADGPLDMRLDRSATVTAAALVNGASERELADVIYRYGEEPLSRKIAREIVAARRESPIDSTLRLAEVVRRAYGPRARQSRMHPATRTFMALRIAANDELGRLELLWNEIERGIDAERNETGSGGGWSAGWLNDGARIAFISFHSLEDRIIKQRMSNLVKRGTAEKITRKPITATAEETELNPRARSAKLRAIRVTATT